MASWDRFKTDTKYVKVELQKVFKIEIPDENLFFWIPKSLCSFSGANNSILHISYCDDFVFKVVDEFNNFHTNLIGKNFVNKFYDFY